MPEELKPNETHVEEESGVVGKPCRIPNAPLERHRAELLDDVAHHAPRIYEFVDITDQRGQVGEPQHEADPKESEAEIVQRALSAEESRQYRQNEEENTQTAKDRPPDAWHSDLYLDRWRGSLGMLSRDKEANHHE